MASGVIWVAALLATLLRAEVLAADIAELHLLERIGAADLARRTLDDVSGATE